jgi:hypothetical protein
MSLIKQVAEITRVPLQHKQQQENKHNTKQIATFDRKTTKSILQQPQDIFHPFTKLPAETRCQIWDLALQDHFQSATIYLPDSITVKSLDDTKTGMAIWQFNTCSESRKEFLRLLFKHPNLKHATRNAAIFRSWAGTGSRGGKNRSLTFMRDSTKPLHIQYPWQIECPRTVIGCVNLEHLVLEELILEPSPTVVAEAYSDRICITQPEERWLVNFKQFPNMNTLVIKRIYDGNMGGRSGPLVEMDEEGLEKVVEHVRRSLKCTQLKHPDWKMPVVFIEQYSRRAIN